MQLGRVGMVGSVAGLVLGGLIGAAGCVGADDEVSSGEQAELQAGFWSHRGHRRHDAGTVGGATGITGGGGMTLGGTGGMSGATSVDAGVPADCDICTQTQACCVAVQGEAGCSFSAAACASETGAGRPAYINACLVELMAIRGARRADQLPPECH